MAYECAPLGRFKVRYDSNNDDNALIFQLVVNGVKVTPASATITIYAPGNSTAILTATAMTVSGSLLTYNIDASDTDDYAVGTGYKAHVIVTVGSVTHDRDIFFDVAENIGSGYLCRDRLLAMDSRIRGMDHAGDEDFSEIIIACRDDMQFDIESRTVDGDQMLDTMVIDGKRRDQVCIYLVLSRILMIAGDSDSSKYYDDLYNQKFKQLLSGFKHDINEDNEEDADASVCGSVRLVL